MSRINKKDIDSYHSLKHHSVMSLRPFLNCRQINNELALMAAFTMRPTAESIDKILKLKIQKQEILN
jgi:hypothetical protein